MTIGSTRHDSPTNRYSLRCKFLQNLPINRHSLQPISLKDREPFAVGGTRRCYLMPGNPDRCVKVLRDDRTPELRRAALKGIRRLRPLRYYDDQLREIEVYERLTKKPTPRLWEHVPEFFGTVPTDMGIGIVTKLFRNHDTSYPLNLEQQVPLGVDSTLQTAIDTFKTWLLDELFLSRDLLPHNIIVVRAEPESCKLVIVDGLGNSEFIPVSNWLRAAARRKIRRKITKFEHRIELLR